jgi:carboxyl-terminal processing protease
MIDGSLLKLTVAKWFTPNGKNIDGEGIMPDIEIEFLEEDYENVYDRQLEEAKKILQIFIEKETI